MGKRKKIIIFSVVGVITVPILVLIIVIAVMFGRQIVAAMSIKTLEEDFYSMEYKGDYGFDEFIENGGASNDKELIEHIVEELYHNIGNVQVGEGPFACSALRATTEEGTVIYGRNFDFEDKKSIVVTTKPKDGYKSISTCNLELLGLVNEWEPDDFINKMMTLASIYVPVDGMNEKGVCVAVFVVNVGAPTNQKTDKPDITTTTAVRLILDKAASVDEAIALLEQYDMHASMGGQYKFAITDASGRHVTVEYLLNKMYVTEVDAVSNFIQIPGNNYGLGMDGLCPRYEKMMDAYEAYEGKITEDIMMDIMESVSMKDVAMSNGQWTNTQWSVVYNTKELSATYCYFGDYEEEFYFEIE